MWCSFGRARDRSEPGPDAFADRFAESLTQPDRLAGRKRDLRGSDRRSDRWCGSVRVCGIRGRRGENGDGSSRSPDKSSARNGAQRRDKQTEVGTFVLGSNGEGRLELRTDRGQAVPVIAAGDSIQIRQGSAAFFPERSADW